MTAPSPAPPADLTDFAVALAGQYELEREIGRGGMGIVYLARDLKLDRRVAIKTLPPHLAADPVVRERFLREARTAGALTQQNIVPVHRADEIDGHVFFVMGYIDGVSMAQRIRLLGRIHAPEVIRELRDVADALAYAHSRGVVHRDVKAENILLDATTGRAMVSDFGIARLAEATPLTSTGQVLGTVYYLSPEQVSGEPVDGRSDVYSLGVVGYLALSGRFPFNAELASAVLIAHVTKTPPPLHEIAPHTPRALTDIIDRCLAKNPADRYQSCVDLRDALDAVAPLVSAEVSERAANSEYLPQQPLLSDTEAQEILSRAAALQAATGVQPRPAPMVNHRDPLRHVSETSGHRLANVRDAAVEAGIPGKYVDHALLEHGLTPSGLPADRPITVADRGEPRSELAGGRMRFEYEVVVDGEMPFDEIDLLVDVIRRNIQSPGQVGTVGRAFTWQGQPQRSNLSVSVLPRGGKTTIRVSDDMRRIAGGLFGGIMGGIGGGTSGVWIGLAAKFGGSHPAILAAAMLAGSITTTYLVARTAFGYNSRRMEARLTSLAEKLAVQVRESIAGGAEAALPKPPDPTRLKQ